MAGVLQPVENKENEDGERLMNCLDLLIAAGYFRARIKGLATFDKIVGGMVWCLSHCSRSVDADLLFAENLDIGQKISLTEKIVQVMTVLKCPHSIEPHQIQGLDLENIYPAIQWLVRMAMDSKASRAQFLNSYIDYQYNKVCKDNTVPDIWKSYKKLHVSVVPQRKFKRGENLMINSLLEDARCTLAEYSGSSIEVERAGALEGGSATVFHSNGLQELSEGNRLKVSTKTAKKVFEAIDRSDLRSREASRGKKNADELENAKAYLRELDKEIESHKKLLAGVNEEYERLGKTLKYQEETLSRFTSEEIREASDAVENYERVKKVEREFKKRYGAELAALENQVTLREEALEDITEDGIAELEKQLGAERLRLAQINHEIADAQYELDTIPSQIEMAQYQRRFIELSDQMASKHRQARQYVTLYNTLLDVRNYIKKDIEMLTKIEEVLPLATKESYRDSFIDNLSTMLRSVEAVQKKVNDRTTILTEEKNLLTAKYNDLKDTRRQFSRMVERLKEECDRNEKLRKLVGEREKRQDL